MLTKVFQRNSAQWGYVKTPTKPHLNPPRFREKSKMDAINPVICVFFINRYHLRTKHRTATYTMVFFAPICFGDCFYLFTFKIPQRFN